MYLTIDHEGNVEIECSLRANGGFYSAQQLFLPEDGSGWLFNTALFARPGENTTVAIREDGSAMFGTDTAHISTGGHAQFANVEAPITLGGEAPSSTTSPGETGMIRVAPGKIWICVAPDTWEFAALSNS